MNNLLEHKGYQGTVQYSDEDEMLFGEVMHVDSLITYYGESVSELKRAFVSAVDDYVEYCRANDLEPEKPYTGNLQVRLGADLHRRLAAQAMKEKAAGERGSINQVIKTAVTLYFQGLDGTEKHTHHHHHIGTETPVTKILASGTGTGSSAYETFGPSDITGAMIYDQLQQKH